MPTSYKVWKLKKIIENSQLNEEKGAIQKLRN